MANSFLTPTMITREALRILHQKLNFVGSINKAYDDSFAQAGARIGSSLRIRLPNQYTVRTGATLSAQDTTESSVTLNVSTQKGVDINFTSADLTMQLDDFSQRIIRPAMAVLASAIESDVLTTVVPSVWNAVGTPGSAITFRNVLQARKKLIDNLVPYDDDRFVRLNTQDNLDLVDTLKGLFQSSTEISRQYAEGVMGSTGGFEFAENTLVPSFTNGAGGRATYLTNGVNQTGATLAIDTGAGAFVAGEVFTIAGVFSVHPETKTSTGVLQQFVVAANYGGGAGNMTISPAIVTTGATQNVSAAAADNSAMTFIGTASTAMGQSLAYHKDFATFATADLIMPNGVDMASRQVQDGISMRLVRQYDINNDKFPCRLDVLYGSLAMRPQLACRITCN